MSLLKELKEKVSIPKDEYIKQQIELESLKFKLVMTQEYIVSHKIINRETVGTMLGIPANMLKGE
jgi:hypothetical protein